MNHSVIAALMKGKLSRRQENMEDLLTSTVFGLLRYLPPAYLGRFLALASDPDGEMPLEPLGKEARLLDVRFWPPMSTPGCSSCEPDVLIEMESGGARYRVLVEAKYLSGKSSFADAPAEEAPTIVAVAAAQAVKDQLAREWENLAASGGGNLALVYLTADAAFPRQDVQEAQDELVRSRGIKGNILWLSWRHLFRTVANGEVPLPLADLLAALRRLGLSDFTGIRLADTSLPQWWRFIPAPRLFPFEITSPGSWRFDRQASQLKWRLPEAALNWSFDGCLGRRWGLSDHALKTTNWRFAP